LSLIRDLITPAESETFLSHYDDWLSLDEPTQERHISAGSVYVQLKWTCEDIDWSDTSGLPVDIKEAIAYYSYANFKGLLYGDPSQSSLNEEFMVSGRIDKLTRTVEFRSPKDFSSSQHPLAYPNSLMSAYCTSNIIGGVRLVRA